MSPKEGQNMRPLKSDIWKRELSGSLNGFQTLISSPYLLPCSDGELFIKSCPTLVTPWTAAYQAHLSMGFPRQEYRSGLPLPTTLSVCSVTQSCPTLCDPMNRSTPGLPVHHQLLEFTQTHAHWVSDAIQPSHPLSPPSPPAPNLSQHQGLFLVEMCKNIVK